MQASVYIKKESAHHSGGHCRAFAPTWEQLAREKQHLERLSGFHMAQVNCLAQGGESAASKELHLRGKNEHLPDFERPLMGFADLCNANNIKFYPQLLLGSPGSPPPSLKSRFSDGQALPPYSGDRSLSDLSQFIDDQSTLYARGQLLAKDSHEEEIVLSGFGRPNPEGKVLEVDEKGLEVMAGNGPVLVDYFAPWCGHCKKLKPIYDQLATALRSKLNVVSVDCEQHGAFCRRQGIKGYPTVRLMHKGVNKDYTGPRSLQKMQQFAEKAVEGNRLQPVKLDDFDDILRTDEAFFLYLQNFDTAVSDLEAVKVALEPLLNAIPAYTSSDPMLYRNLSIANPVPTSVLLAFSSPSEYPVGSLSFPTDLSTLQRFVQLHRFPTLVQLSSANYADIMRSEMRPVVVLGAVHKGDEGARERESFERIARAWKRGGRGFDQPVWFVWVEGDKASWLKQAYGIKTSMLPAAVVIDPALSEYYDMTIEGTKISFDGASIFSVLEGFYQHFLRPKRSESTLEWGSRSATMTLISFGEACVDHPFTALFSLLGAVGVFVFLLQRCLVKDPRETEKSNGLRLD